VETYPVELDPPSYLYHVDPFPSELAEPVAPEPPVADILEGWQLRLGGQHLEEGHRLRLHPYQPSPASFAAVEPSADVADILEG